MLHRGTNLVISFILSLILAIVAHKSLSLPCTFLTGLTWTHCESESTWVESESESIRPESETTEVECESKSESTGVESESLTRTHPLSPNPSPSPDSPTLLFVAQQVFLKDKTWCDNLGAESPGCHF